MTIFSKDLKTNRLFDATIDLAVNQFGFELDKLADKFVDIWSNRLISRIKAGGKFMYIYDYVCHEISHLIVEEGDDAFCTEGWAESSDRAFPGALNELHTVALQVCLNKHLKPTRKFSTKTLAYISNIREVKEPDREVIISNLAKLPEVEKMARRLSDLIKDKAIISELKYLAQLDKAVENKMDRTR